MVVTCVPTAWTASTRHELTTVPSRCTAHEAHSPSFHDRLVPVSPRSSRSTSTSERSGSTSRSYGTPLTSSWIGILFMCARRGVRRSGAGLGRVGRQQVDQPVDVVGIADGGQSLLPHPLARPPCVEVDLALAVEHADRRAARPPAGAG